MIKAYLVPSRKITREYRFIKQGLENHLRINLINNPEKADFIFLFYTTLKHEPDIHKSFPKEKLVFIDFHDKPSVVFDVDCKAYFKRSWVEPYVQNGWWLKREKKWPSHFHPINFGIMDEFITEDEGTKRDITLSCTIRPHERHPNRPKVLEFIKGLDIPGKTQIGELNKGNMNRFNDEDMRDYFKLLRRSQIVVTCNPSRWEGDFRTWEAMASGALVFVDRMYIPMKHPLISGKHCYIYEPSDAGMQRMKDLIFYYIKNSQLAKSIALRGQIYSIQYHKAVSRIDEILEIVNEP